MPDAYFFRSKDALYEAVLARVVARAEKELACARPRHRPLSGGGRDVIRECVCGHLRPRSEPRPPHPARSLEEGSRLAEFLTRLADDAVAVFSPIAQQAGVSPQRLVLDIFALAWYPIAHAHAPISTRDELARASLP